MSVAHTLCAPLGLWTARDILDLVEGILNEAVDVVGSEVVAAERVTGEDTKDRLCATVLRPLQKLQQTKTVGRAIAPRTHVARSLIGIADGALPVEAVAEIIALEVVAAGEAQELRLHPAHHLHEILAESVRPVVERLREEHRFAQVIRSLIVGSDDKACVLRGLDLFGHGQLEALLLPVLPESVDLCGGKDRLAVVADKAQRERSATAFLGFGDDISFIMFFRADGHTPKSAVGNACSSLSLPFQHRGIGTVVSALLREREL